MKNIRPRENRRLARQHPGVLHPAATGDVDQLAARSCDAGHGAGNDIDRLCVGGEGVDAVVGVGVAQDEAILAGLAEDVGREIRDLLGHVLDRVLFDRFAEFLDILPGLFRGDEDVFAAPAAAAFDDELVEVVYDVAAVIFDGEGVGLDVVEYRLLAEVGSDHLGDKGIDAFVVGDAEVGGEDGVDQAPCLGFDQAGYVVVDPAVLDALVDDVQPATALFVDEASAAVYLDLVPLGQDRPELFSENPVVEVVLVVGASGEDRYGRVGVGRSGPKNLAEALHQTV